MPSSAQRLRPDPPATSPQIHGIVRKRRLESQAGEGEEAAPVPRGISIPIAAAPQPAPPAQSRCCAG